MAILSKGYSFGSTEQVTSTKLGNLVDAAAFVSGSSGTCASGGGLEVTGGGQLQIANTSITSTKLSTGAPSWTSGGNLTVGTGGNFTCGGTGTFGGTISTSGNIEVNGTSSITGTSTFTGNATFAGQIIRSGTASNRTVQLKTGAVEPNAISFGWNGADLLVTIDGDEFKVTLTEV